MDTSDLSRQSLESRLPSAFLEGGREGSSILRLRYDILTYTHISLSEGGIRLFDDVREALADHLDDDALHIALEWADHGSTHLFGGYILLVVDVDRVLRSLWICCDPYDGRCIVLYLGVDALSWIDGSGDVGEGLLDLSLYLIDVDVPYDD